MNHNCGCINRIEENVVKVYLKDGATLPEYKTLGAAGMDIKTLESKELKPLERCLIKTGIFLEIPKGYEVQVRSRSGLALNSGVTVLNSPGTIDSDYRGEVGVILVNISNDSVFINQGERIAQLVLNKVENMIFEAVDDLSLLTDTSRGSGGYSSTGKL